MRDWIKSNDVRPETSRLYLWTIYDNCYCFSSYTSIIYFAVLKKLYPLKKLHGQIEQFAGGNLDIKIEYEGNDEIGKNLPKNFDKTISTI